MRGRQCAEKETRRERDTEKEIETDRDTQCAERDRDNARVRPGSESLRHNSRWL